MKVYSRQNVQNDERGITAIVVTVILLIVITITTLGFAQVVRREQRQALDNQLSTQAFYAAESGINLAKSKLGSIPTEKNNCDATAPFSPAEYEVSASSDVYITCLLIEKELDVFQFQNVTEPRIVKLKDRVGQNFREIFVAWEAYDGNVSMPCMTANSLPSLSGVDTWNCGQPLVRVDLVPLCEVAGCLSQTNLAATQSTMFLYPVATGAKPTPIDAVNARAEVNDTHKYAVRCTPSRTTAHPRYCAAQINVSGSSVYGMRLSSLYGAANISVYANNASGRSTLIEGLARIDSTARAIDVLKRVQVYVGSAESENEASGPLTITGTGLCKRYFVTDTATTGTGSILDPNNPCGIN
jgi:hypothetical protein